MRNKKALSLILVVLSLYLLLLSCSPKAGVTTQKQGALSPPQTEGSSQSATGEWDKLISLAKKEGRLSLYSSTGSAELKTPLVKAMKEKFGFVLELIVARGDELAIKLQNERKAGIFSVDVYIGGGSMVNDLKPGGVFEPLEPQFILPEILDGKAWWEARLPWVDKDKQVFAFVANPSPPLTINVQMVREEEIKSYRDLLNPRWKGKMVLNDPTIAGVSQNWFVAVSSGIMNVDFMRELAGMDLMVTRDQRLQVEWVSHGKYPIAIGAQPSTVGQFIKDGAPLKLVTPKEGTFVTSGAGNIALINRAPHPNAAKLFINWLLTREGQTIFSDATNFQSARNDVPTSFLDPERIRKEGVKYFSIIPEEFIKTFPEHVQEARVIFNPVSK